MIFRNILCGCIAVHDRHIDDHALIRKALKDLINHFENFEVVLDAANGKDFIDQLQTNAAPDIVLVDINMPVMDGYATAKYISENHLSTKIIALTVNDDDESIIKMLRAGAAGYLLKDTDTKQLKETLEEVAKNGYFHSDLVRNSMVKSLQPQPLNPPRVIFRHREVEFLKFVCTELTYKEIADKMCVSPRTVDGYREGLFEKLQIKSRVGLVLFALKNEIFIV